MKRYWLGSIFLVLLTLCFLTFQNCSNNQEGGAPAEDPTSKARPCVGSGCSGGNTTQTKLVNAFIGGPGARTQLGALVYDLAAVGTNTAIVFTIEGSSATYAGASLNCTTSTTSPSQKVCSKILNTGNDKGYIGFADLVIDGTETVPYIVQCYAGATLCEIRRYNSRNTYGHIRGVLVKASSNSSECSNVANFGFGTNTFVGNDPSQCLMFSSANSALTDGPANPPYYCYYIGISTPQEFANVSIVGNPSYPCSGGLTFAAANAGMPSSGAQKITSFAVMVILNTETNQVERVRYKSECQNNSCTFAPHWDPGYPVRVSQSCSSPLAQNCTTLQE